MFKVLLDDIQACMDRDPAARSRWDVVMLYPGFHAVTFYRLGHWLWRHNLFFLGRFVCQFGRFFTGIDIHPGAKIGPGFFIDHGTGVVIGETGEIGANVTLYHDVTLGGIAPSVDSIAQQGEKRHPTLKDDVIVGSGAQILGPITVHEGARVGANSVVLRDVPPHTTAVGIPAKIIGRAREDEPEHFDAYGTRQDYVDPMDKVTDALLDKVQGLSMRVEELERRLKDGASSALLEGKDKSEEPDAHAGGAGETRYRSGGG